MFDFGLVSDCRQKQYRRKQTVAARDDPVLKKGEKAKG
jgi:hypothetical protein